MKFVKVPAHIIKVETIIFGNISLQQLGVFGVDLAVVFFFYAFFPPGYSYSVFKLTIILWLITGGMFLVSKPGHLLSQSFSRRFLGTREAVLEGKMIAEWLLLLMQYFWDRPRVYLHRKNFDLPQQLLAKPKIEQRKTTVVTKQHKGVWEEVIDRRAFPMLMKNTLAHGRIADVVFEDTYRVRLVGESQQVYVEKMETSGLSQGSN